MLKMEMNVGKLKQEIANLPDDMPVYVACERTTNYYKSDTDTFAIVKDGKLFIVDECTVEIDGVNI